MTFSFFISLVIFGLIMATSWLMALSAARKSRPFQSTNDNHACYVVQNAQILDQNLLNQIFNYLPLQEQKISFEVLFNGSAKALVMYAPIDIKHHFSQLQLLEIEDYTADFATNPPQLVLWQPVLSAERLSLTADQLLSFNLTLQPNERVFWQLIRLSGDMQKTPRINLVSGVSAPTPTRTAEITNQINQSLARSTNLQPQTQLTKHDLVANYQSRQGEWGSQINLQPDQLIKLLLA